MNNPTTNVDPAGLFVAAGSDWMNENSCTVDGFAMPCGFIGPNSVLGAPGGGIGQYQNVTNYLGLGQYSLVASANGWVWINDLNGEELDDPGSEDPEGAMEAELPTPWLGSSPFSFGSSEGPSNGSPGAGGGGNSACVASRVLAVIPGSQPTGTGQNQGGHYQTNFTFTGNLSTVAAIGPNAFSVFGINNGYRFGGVFFSLHVNSASFNPFTNTTSFQAHEDIFNPATGLFGIVGHGLFDVGIGTLFFNHSSSLDRRCP